MRRRGHSLVEVSFVMPTSADVETIQNLAGAFCRGVGTDTWPNWIGEDARSKLTHYTFDAKSVSSGLVKIQLARTAS